jgi:hypothetical protein
LKVSALSSAEFSERLAGDGIRLAAGPFNCRLQSGIPEIAGELARLYAHHPLIDATVRGLPRGRPARPRPAALAAPPGGVLIVDAIEPFTPLPRDQSLPMLEWGLNWCITAYSQHILVIHAASVARGNRAAILPAPPGLGQEHPVRGAGQSGLAPAVGRAHPDRLDTGELMGLAPR